MTQLLAATVLLQ